MKTQVSAICPVLHRTDDFGGEAIRYPMFWIEMNDLRPYISRQYVFTDNDNNLARYNLDDFFTMGMYKGEIYKTKNLRNLSMVQMFPDPEGLKRAQDSIENRLSSFDKNLWIPSREELQARAEAADSVAMASSSEGEEIAIRSRDEDNDNDKKEKQKTRNKRSKRSKPKKSEVKEAKVSSSSSAVRSVRRRK